MKSLLGTILSLFVIIFWLPATAATQGADGAFVTQSTGDVSYIVDKGSAQPLPTFSKLFSGTQVRVTGDAKFQIVYLENGRQESWTGPVEVEIGQNESRAINGSSSPAIKELPQHMLGVLTKSRDVISDIQSRQGMIRVRSLTTARKVKEAEATYATMRGEAAADDITPEIYLLTAFDELKVYKRMKAPLEEIMKRQPNNAEAKKLHDQFMSILEAEEKALQ